VFTADELKWAAVRELELRNSARTAALQPINFVTLTRVTMQ